MGIEEIQSNRAVDLLARNKQQAEKITELERIIVEAKACVKITQEEKDKQHKAFYKAIKPVVHWYNRDTILATVIDIVADLQKDRAAVLKQAERNNVTQKEITALLRSIVHLRTSSNENLKRIERNLKLVKIQI